MANKIVIKKSSVAGKVPVPADLDVGELGVNVTDKKLYTKDSTGVIVELIGGGGGGGGDVTGPASSTDNALTRFDGITGKVIQASIVSLDDDGNLANVNGLAFDTTPTNPPTAIGGMYWNAGDGTPAVILDNDVTLNLGQENLVKVFNNSASTITKGQVVAVNGAQGQRPAVVLADADSEPLSAATLGIADEDIAAGAEGFASTFGVIRGIDTSGFTAGQPVYLSQTAGAYTATRPAAPAHTVFLGWIIKVNASSGEIFLNINNGWELNELHNVLISSPVNGNTLIYDQALGVWKNASITAGTGISVTNGAGSISVANTGVTSFSGGTTGLTPATGTTGNITLAGTLGVGNGGTGLTSYTLNGVVYASGTGTLATGSALTFDGTNLINTGAYTAPNNGAGAGTKTTIRGSTGTGQAGASGGNGFIELVGGGGTSTWTAFSLAMQQRRRGGINLQAGTAQADAGNTYVNGSTINILGSAGTNNGTATGVGSQVLIQSGATTKIDGQSNTGSSINLSISSSTVGSSTNITSGSFNTSAGGNGGGYITLVGATATTGGNVTLGPGLTNIAGSTVGKAYVRDPATNTDNEILTTNRIVAGTNITVTNSSGFLTIAASGGGSPALPAARGTVYGYMSNAGDGSQVSLGQYTPGAPTTSWPGYPEWNANVATTANGTNALASATGVVQSNVMFSTGTGYSPGTWTYPVNGTNAYGISDYITYSLTVTIDSTGQVMSATVVVTGYASGFNPFRGFVDDPYYNIYLSDYPFAPWGNGNNDGQVTVSMYYERASYNTAIGAYTLSVLNSSGANQYGNTAVGAYAASGLVGGSDNTAIGSYALTNAANGDYNVAIGTAAGQNGTAPATSVFIGYAAGFSYESNGSVIIGFEAGRNATYGSGNTFIGTAAGYSVNSGNNNTFVGRDSGYFVTSGYGHTIIGCHNGIGNGLNISTLSNYIVLSDGNGSARIAVDSSGRTQFRSNVVMPYQGTPTTKAAAATLTGAELATGLLNTTGTTYTITLPTGTNIEGAIAWSNTNVCLDWFVINTASGAITIAANGNATLGSLIIATGVSAHFRIRRTAANTFTVYRLT
jgi:hypothetical protein